MKDLLVKEFKLSTMLLTYLFIGFGLMTFIPGYPILCGAFFMCLGVFQSYQRNRENSDILYAVLLPVSKTDVVKAKYLAAVILQAATFVLCLICTLVRMIFMSGANVYTENVLMGANFVYLAFVLIIFGCFNVIFIGGFFKTAYKQGKPFVTFIVVNFVIIGIAESLHHLPGLDWLGTLDFGFAGRQCIILLTGLVIYVVMTAFSCRKSCEEFERIDL